MIFFLLNNLLNTASHLKKIDSSLSHTKILTLARLTIKGEKLEFIEENTRDCGVGVGCSSCKNK